MAAVGAGNPTLLDHLRRLDPDGKIADIGEVLNQSNPVLMDATVLPGNKETGHLLTIRDGLPTVGYRLINQGVAASKSRTIQVEEACALLEGRSEVDCELARLNGNEAAFRKSEDDAFLEAMAQQAAGDMFYASSATNPEKFHGLLPRFNSLSGGNSNNIVNYAGTALSGDAVSGDAYSIWFVTWHPQACFMVFPKNTKGGLEKKDLGMDYADDANGDKYLAWRTHFIWRLGLCVKDWRYIVRFCNIDPDNVVKTENFLIDGMIMCYNRLHKIGLGRQVIYMNRWMLELLDLQINNKANVNFGTTDWHGKEVTSFRGIPILTCDTLATAETAVA